MKGFFRPKLNAKPWIAIAVGIVLLALAGWLSMSSVCDQRNDPERQNTGKVQP